MLKKCQVERVWGTRKLKKAEFIRYTGKVVSESIRYTGKVVSEFSALWDNH